MDFVATLIAGLVAIGAFMGWRAAQLRREEVLQWGNRCVEVLQLLQLRCDAQVHNGSTSHALSEQAEHISVLVEQGRLFFKNASPEKHGVHKEPAYRGFRPVILDQLVFAYQVANEWEKLSPADQRAGLKVVVCCKERFVSLLQREVGRKRAADRYNIEGGNGHGLRSLISMAHAGKSPSLPAEDQSVFARARRFVRF